MVCFFAEPTCFASFFMQLLLPFHRITRSALMVTGKVTGYFYILIVQQSFRYVNTFIY